MEADALKKVSSFFRASASIGQKLTLTQIDLMGFDINLGHTFGCLTFMSDRTSQLYQSHVYTTV